MFVRVRPRARAREVSQEKAQKLGIGPTVCVSRCFCLLLCLYLSVSACLLAVGKMKPLERYSYDARIPELLVAARTRICSVVIGCSSRSESSCDAFRVVSFLFGRNTQLNFGRNYEKRDRF